MRMTHEERRYYNRRKAEELVHVLRQMMNNDQGASQHMIEMLAAIFDHEDERIFRR